MTRVPQDTPTSGGETLKWRIGDRIFPLGGTPLLMGILNVTPDSFSDGGRYTALKTARQHADQLIADGADIIDIGGESTRPGAEPVSLQEELDRVLPVVEAIANSSDVLISIDTTKSAVADATLSAGAHIVNDISGLTFDADMPSVCARRNAGVVCMHIQGTPRTMQNNPQYDDVVADIRHFLQQRLAALAAAGIPAESVVLDPGIGFGKTAAHNLEILRNIASLRALGRPGLVGHSRKRFLAKVLGRPVDERVFGTVGVSVALAAQSVDILRIHDVAATRDALIAWSAIHGHRSL